MYYLYMTVLVLAVIAYSRNKRPDQKFGHGDVDDDVRENIISYDDEGGGEDDMQAFDITPLRIPIDATGTPLAKGGLLGKGLGRPLYASGQHPDIGQFIHDHLERVDQDDQGPPFDDLRNYAYEGCGSIAGSLESLNSCHEDNEQDFDYLNTWGPRFQKLAHMYVQHDSDED
jgi:hypothetical protein